MICSHELTTTSRFSSFYVEVDDPVQETKDGTTKES